MPIHLRAPGHVAGGPDGQGWNRLSLNAHMATPTDRCALRPRTHSALFESYDTRRAQWGGNFAACTNGGDCGNCPVMHRKPFHVPWDGEDGRVLVRVQPRHVPGMDTTPGGVPDRLWVMQDASAGWDSRAVQATWEDLAAVEPRWSVGRQHRDEHGEGFWLERAQAPSVVAGGGADTTRDGS